MVNTKIYKRILTIYHNSIIQRGLGSQPNKNYTCNRSSHLEADSSIWLLYAYIHIITCIHSCLLSRIIPNTFILIVYIITCILNCVLFFLTVLNCVLAFLFYHLIRTSLLVFCVSYFLDSLISSIFFTCFIDMSCLLACFFFSFGACLLAFLSSAFIPFWVCFRLLGSLYYFFPTQLAYFP